MDYNSILKEIFSEPVWKELESKSAHQKLLWLKARFSADSTLIYNQILLRNKLQRKLPEWYNQLAWVTPKAMEQASSSATARYKAGLISGNHLLDICGGLGVDDTFFSSVFRHIVSLDVDTELNKLVRHNNQLFGITNILRVDSSAENFLNHTSERFDWVYADADRRTEESKRVIGLAHATPSVLELRPTLYSIANALLLKCSPMEDINALASHFEGSKHIRVVSIKNEVKEILLTIEQTKPSLVYIEAVAIDREGNEQFSYPSHIQTVSVGSSNTFFYEPDTALIKSGLWRAYFKDVQLTPLSNQCAYAIAKLSVEPFWGRRFKLVEQIPFSLSKALSYVKQSQITHAHIACRNFVMHPEELRKRMSLADGGNTYLFFAMDSMKKKWMFHTEKES